MRGLNLILTICLAEVLYLLPMATFPALVPDFVEQWSLSNTEAGWISGSYYLGYMLTVPVLTALTDRYDARLVLLAGCLIGALATFGFALFADGFWSAMLWRTLGGIGLAGSYMPGLKALNDRNDSPVPSRGMVLYTSSYSLGVGLSFLLAGEAQAALGWQAAFHLAAAGPAAALLLMLVVLQPKRPVAAAASGRLLDFRPVFANKAALGYILGYTGHCHELMAMRAWIVAFMAFAAARAGGEPTVSATVIAAIVTVIGVPSSILGNELSLRFGRRRVVTAILAVSALLSCGIGIAAGISYWLAVAAVLLYAVTVTADSGSLTAGAISAAPSHQQGATMAVHSTLGIGVSFIGPLVVGVVLDLAGGGVLAWALAFLTMGAGAAMGSLAVAKLAPRT
ncbi:MAG: MFS transporter [Reyranellaceae bacterium]